MDTKLSQPVAMSQKVSAYRWLALLSHISLIVYMLVWYFVLPQELAYSATFIISIYIVPLLLPLPGIIKAKPYTHAWASFIVLLYFLHAITVMYSVEGQLFYGLFELLLATTMFIGCCMFARLRGQELGTALPKLKDVMEQEKNLFEGNKNEQKDTH